MSYEYIPDKRTIRRVPARDSLPKSSEGVWSSDLGTLKVQADKLLQAHAPYQDKDDKATRAGEALSGWYWKAVNALNKVGDSPDIAEGQRMCEALKVAIDKAAAASTSRRGF